MVSGSEGEELKVLRREAAKLPSRDSRSGNEKTAESDPIEVLFDEIGDAVRERPALAMLTAFGVGLAVGYLFSRR